MTFRVEVAKAELESRRVGDCGVKKPRQTICGFAKVEVRGVRSKVEVGLFEVEHVDHGNVRTLQNPPMNVELLQDLNMSMDDVGYPFVDAIVVCGSADGVRG